MSLALFLLGTMAFVGLLLFVKPKEGRMFAWLPVTIDGRSRWLIWVIAEYRIPPAGYLETGWWVYSLPRDGE